MQDSGQNSTARVADCATHGRGEGAEEDRHAEGNRQGSQEIPARGPRLGTQECAHSESRGRKAEEQGGEGSHSQSQAASECPGSRRPCLRQAADENHGHQDRRQKAEDEEANTEQIDERKALVLVVTHP